MKTGKKDISGEIGAEALFPSCPAQQIPKDGIKIFPRRRNMKRRKNGLNPSTISVALIDDDEIVANAVSRLCERCGGVSIHSLSSSETALEWLSRNPVDVIVSDFHMPGMNDMELIKKIKESGNTAPCIIFTGVEMSTILKLSSVSGVGIYGYVQKEGPIHSQIVALMELIVQASVHAGFGEEDPLKKTVMNMAK
jgi:DNA-binding NtrC family response regulator